MSRPASTVPADLLNAVASKNGRVALIVGAGCSLEEPTALKLSRDYSVEVHDALVADGVLSDGDCERPEDLSLLADHVYDRKGSQADIVKRLPRQQFRFASPNTGHLDAIAMMLEGAICCVMTLNYDLALTNAITQLSGTVTDIGVVNGPETVVELSTKSVIYLHSNVEESNPDKWIMRKSDLENAWQNTWEELVASRVSATPFLVFLGLGSPAAILTESVSRIRRINSGTPGVYFVDPDEESQFAASLGLSQDNMIRMSWCDFMEHLAKRVVREPCVAIRQTAQEICAKQDREISEGCFSDLVDLLQSAGLRVLGIVRARWLCGHGQYAVDDRNTYAALALLLLALGEILIDSQYKLAFSADGRITVNVNRQRRGSAMGLHGAGVMYWEEGEQYVTKMTRDMIDPPDVVLATGFIGSPPISLSLPKDIVYDTNDDDIVGELTPRLIDIESIRGMGRLFTELAR